MKCKKYYSVLEVAEHFSISTKTVYRLIDEGELKSVKIKNILRVSANEIDRYEKKIVRDGL